MAARFAAAATTRASCANRACHSPRSTARLDARSESSNTARHAAPGGRFREHGKNRVVDVRFEPSLAAGSAGACLGHAALVRRQRPGVRGQRSEVRGQCAVSFRGGVFPTFSTSRSGLEEQVRSAGLANYMGNVWKGRGLRPAEEGECGRRS